MKIRNYLLGLDNQIYCRKGSDNIRIYGLGEHIKQIYNDLKEFMDIKDIERQFKTHQEFSDWILNKRGIAIQELYSLHLYWEHVCDKSEEELQELWDKCYNLAKCFGCMNGKKIVLPKKVDYQLAYLLGVICGDGHLAEPNHSYDKLTSYNSELRITDQNQETFVFLTKFFKKLFDYTPKIYSEKSKVDKLFYRFVIKSKPLHRFLLVVCGIPALEIHWQGPYVYKYQYNNCNIKIYKRDEVQKFLNAIPSLNPIKFKQREMLWERLRKV